MSIYYVGSVPYSDELYHHGVEGMHWGVRHDYVPKGPSTASGTKNGSAASQSQTKETIKNEKKRRIKNAIKIGAAVVGAGLLAYGAYKVAKGIQEGHENFVDRMTMHKLSNEMSTRDLFMKQLDFNDRMEAYANPYASKNANIQSINNIFNRKVASIIQEGEALKTGASFVERISNAHKWAKFGKYA